MSEDRRCIRRLFANGMECAVRRWLPHRLPKFQSLYTTALFRTTHSPGRSYSTYMYLYMYMYCLDKYLYTSLFFFLFWFLFWGFWSGKEVSAGSAHICKIYRKSYIKPPLSKKPPPSNKPHPLRRLISPPFY